jgi:hypothetical protein
MCVQYPLSQTQVSFTYPPAGGNIEAISPCIIVFSRYWRRELLNLLWEALFLEMLCLEYAHRDGEADRSMQTRDRW